MVDSYDEYWIKKLQQLWQAHELLRKKVDMLEMKLGQPQQTAAAAEAEEAALSEKELTVCMALKELGDFASVEDINKYLRETRNIDEPLRETLLLRLRGAVDKSYVKYDSQSKKFRVAKDTFIVK